ncbi:hypothetical protein PPSIR1_38499 [Plesiocystis pacifica SIR-1]|uniref:Uncharacterized protein n=1 Tax=Plesiocystis pacifica SIR-1 TaxID=391625 RepID=A6G8M3_9BACT|nr:hypothetical protein PPSIR1_38499 [Plesiocystis pacifica SIR-1]
MLALAPAAADAEYRDLCDSSKVCEYTGPNAPLLNAAVCLDPAGQVRLKGSTACPQGSVPFHARYGEVYEPTQQLVVAYIPLESACSVPEICQELPDGYTDNTSTAQNICCIGAVCWPGSDCGGTLLWCDDGVCNEDGTVTCFEGMEIP